MGIMLTLSRTTIQQTLQGLSTVKFTVKVFLLCYHDQEQGLTEVFKDIRLYIRLMRDTDH